MDNQSAIIFGSIIAGGIVISIIWVSYFTQRNQSPEAQSHSQSIKLSNLKPNYNIGQRLNFTIDTFGVCASPDVILYRVDASNGESLIVFDYRASPVRCPPFAENTEPHFVWNAEQLITRFSDEAYGGDGNSVLTSSAAIVLKKPGNYTITASLIDASDRVSGDFEVH